MRRMPRRCIFNTMPHINLGPGRPDSEVTPILGWWPWITLGVAALVLALGVWRFTASPREPGEPGLGIAIFALGALLLILLRAYRRREGARVERELAALEATGRDELPPGRFRGIQGDLRGADRRFRRMAWSQELALALATVCFGLSVWLGFPALRGIGTALGFGALAWGALPLGRRFIR